jgi:hypothetical protein
MTKKKIIMAKLLAENFERFGHTITHQQRRGALPKVAQGEGLRFVWHGARFADFQTFKSRPCFADAGQISKGLRGARTARGLGKGINDWVGNP